MTQRTSTLLSATIGARRRAGVLEPVLSFWRRHGTSYLFLAPYLILFGLFYVVPIVVAGGLSVTYFNVLESPRAIGLTNYVNLLLEDDIFMLALWNTLQFAVITGPLGFILAFLFAWIINSTGRAKVALTLIFYVPSIVSGVAIAIVWRYLFSGDSYGLINYVVMSLGIMDEPFLWLQDVRTLLPIIMVVALWMSMGTGFLAFLAGLQNVPRELYESATVDGIPTRWHELWYITLPLVKPQLLLGAVLAVVASFNVFDIAVSMAGFPSPLYAGHTIVTHLWDYAFLRFEMGYASAIAVVLFVLTFGINRILMRVFSTKGDY